MIATTACVVCKNPIGDGERFVLLRRGREEAHCSQVCLVARLERHRRARWRWLLRATAVALVAIGAPRLWHRVRVPQAESISFEPPEMRPVAAPRLEPPVFGPAWPPTDQDWLFAFANTTWTYPLPGPARRLPASDDRILSSGAVSTSRAGRVGSLPAVCRVPGRCGVDLGGELWGEHVYAVHDGVVDHLQHATGEERGEVYLRLAHFGGMVFTHYVHLAAVPRGLARGVAVKAGDLIGLVGDTGTERRGPYVHFALSVRPSSALPEVYWDPTDLMVHWPLRLPPHGTVAGYVPRETDLTPPPIRRRPK